MCLFLIYSRCLPRPTAQNGKGGIRKSALGTLKSRSTHVAQAGNLMAASSGETAKNLFFFYEGTQAATWYETVGTCETWKLGKMGAIKEAWSQYEALPVAEEELSPTAWALAWSSNPHFVWCRKQTHTNMKSCAGGRLQSSFKPEVAGQTFWPVGHNGF